MNAQVPSQHAPHRPTRRATVEEAAAQLLTAGEALCKAGQIMAELAPRPEQRQTAGPAPASPHAGASAEERLSGKQLGAIRGMARRAGLSRDRLAVMLDELTGKGEPAALSRVDASIVLDKLSAMTGYAR